VELCKAYPEPIIDHTASSVSKPMRTSARRKSTASL
jgi:hypothetical protein